MPELPEVETIKLQLEKTIKGLKITGIEVLKKKSFIGNPEDVVGKKVIGVTRRAKITLIELENGFYLAIHLKMTGQLIFRNETQISKLKTQNQNLNLKTIQKNGPFEIKGLPNKYTRVIIHFDQGDLYFNDLRIFGWIKIVQISKLKVQSLEEELGLEKYGPEANDKETFTLEYFCKLLAISHKPIKLIIMDQEKLSGLGNIYANEALFRAGIMPTRPGKSLSEKETKILRDSILSVLSDAIKHRGTSDTDEAFRQITGEKGDFQKYLQVYGKKGEKCPKCGGIIERMALGGRGTFFCKKCQR